MGQGTLAELTGSSRNTVNKALKLCEELGYFSSVQQFDSSKIYTFIGVPLIEKITKSKGESNPMIRPKASVNSNSNSNGKVETIYDPNSEIRQQQETDDFIAEVNSTHKEATANGGSISVADALKQNNNVSRHMIRSDETSDNNHDEHQYDECQLDEGEENPF